MSSFNRIGRALIKYFKPVRVGPPHYQGEKYNSNEGSKEQSNSDKNNQNIERPSKDRFAESKRQVHSSIPAWEDPQANSAHLPAHLEHTEKTPATWLNLVLGLFKSCKKAGDKVRKRIGFGHYERQAKDAGKDKLLAAGSIIDTSADKIEPKSKAS